MTEALTAQTLALRQEHPDWSYQTIAKKIGWDRHHVRRVIEHAERQKGGLVPAHGFELVTRAPEPRTAEEFAERINACWRESVAGIIKAGEWLSRAKAALARGEFGAMIESRLSFSASTAQRLMAIASDARLTNPAHVQHLPPAWGTLYELTKLDDQQFQVQLEQGKIRPDMERREAINGARAIMSGRQEPDDSLDFFPTPPWATRALCESVMPELGFVGCVFDSVWEPACGEGHMAEVLREYSRDVITTDIHSYGYTNGLLDFLTPELVDGCRHPSTGERLYDWIITNPPFGDKTEAFVLRALDLAKVGVAMFVRLQWLETIGRYETIFKDRPPTLIAFFCERVNLCKGRWEPEGSTATAYIWLVWIKGKAPQAPFWIPPGQRQALTYPDDAERFTAHPVKPRILEREAAE